MSWLKGLAIAAGGALALGLAMGATKKYELDALSKRRLEGLVPRARELAMQLLQEAAAAGIPVVITHGLRTMQEQADLYAQGRTAPGKIVTNAKPGSSAHNYGAAIDVAFLMNGKYTAPGPGQPWEKLGRIGKRIGFVWGGETIRFADGTYDNPHFELSDWRNLRPIA